MVYKFVVLSDEDDSFIREFEFLDTHTLLDFHNTLQNELEFDKSQMASFFIATDSWEREEEFTLFDMGAGPATMESAVLEDIIFRKNQKLFYLFDLFNERGLLIEFTGEAEDDDNSDNLPACTNSKGVPPRQIIFGSRSRKQYNNIVMSDDEDSDMGMAGMGMVDDIDDDLFFSEDDEEGPLPGFGSTDNINEEDYYEE
jgi:hypothetical protein